MRSLILILSFIGLVSSARKLPSHIKACKKSEFSTCGLKTGQASIPKLWKGDPSINLPSMDPLVIKKIVIADDGQQKFRLNVNFTDLTAVGLKNVKLDKIALVEMGPIKRIVVGFSTNSLVCTAKYSVNGQVIILPITGSGPCELKLEQPSFVFNLDYKMKKIKGVDHLENIKVTHTHKMKKLSIRLDNLFNGNKLLGDNMNQVLNENWEALSEQVGTGMVAAIVKEMRPFLRAIIEEVPFNQLVL